MQWVEFSQFLRHFSSKQREHIRQAFALGERLHRGQTRRSGEPYFTHPIAVALRLAEAGADVDTIIAALLHDVVEDTPITLDELDMLFDGDVRSLIDGVTKLSAADIADHPNLDEQIESLRKIFTLMQQDLRIIVIKLFDRLHNMQTVQYLPPEKGRALAKETRDVYVNIADRLSMQDLKEELEVLCFGTLEPERYERMALQRKQNAEVRAQTMDGLQHILEQYDPDLIAKTTMRIEPRPWEKLALQLELDRGALPGITIPHSVIFVCADRAACYRMLGALHECWKQRAMSFQDFINSPTINGYRGLHTTVILSDGTRVRCKIRTPEMEEYAHKGVTLYCFDPRKRAEIPFLLPWTQRISSVTEDTKGRSQDFWQNLQSDILGEAITIHGPDDSSALVPKDITILDGAFYLFNENALRLQSIRADGKEVSFHEPLTDATTLEPDFGDEPTVQREWLGWVKTGFAAAHIREAFAGTLSDKEKIGVGKTMLQSVMQEKGKGFIEEFQEETLGRKLQPEMGYKSLDEAYRAIADGRLSATEVCEALFQKKITTIDARSQQIILQYRMDMNNTDTLRQIHKTHRKYGNHLAEIRYRWGKNGIRGSIALKGSFSSSEQQSLARELSASGGRDIRIMYPWERISQIASTILLVILWGLDPVFAHYILTTARIPIADLTLMRFVLFFFVACCAYGTQKILYPSRFKPLPIFHFSLFLSGIALFCTAFSTYLSLVFLPASIYIIFIIGILVLWNILFMKKQLWKTWSGLLCLGTLGIITIDVLFLHSWPAIGMLAAIGSGASFALYSRASTLYLEVVGKVRERYPAYLFWVSIICLVLSAFLLPFTDLSALAFYQAVQAIIFSLIFAILPYGIYFELMRRSDNAFLQAILPFVYISTFLGESILQHTIIAIESIPLVILFLWLQARLQQSGDRVIDVPPVPAQ
ncbi:HD domain-containing protein [Candidatus Peregrinibacteria bacterium]|nr:HD domain-containing protein [Candidatus Peregrinibacteria bacterium]